MNILESSPCLYFFVIQPLECTISFLSCEFPQKLTEVSLLVPGEQKNPAGI